MFKVNYKDTKTTKNAIENREKNAKSELFYGT